ncbi:uncharacterized protein L969DRAFT_104727 [Mixia osmundae IAM 14324]|uniref:Kinesin motor domain-containing protein n=1 Tax=Mixia osmundae (strain CBS 9802 / IAM 14324 / JCM 22182 / KY 12970) TaxID=764103 RepID=G7DWV8_MIXOS|nr:uncharacterized protein L969DRAFT_106145 [Mixia osmundae IAM 14324]XP_014566699.1 uncharacterized protein L969DRAFT_104727 [Mixia osmundae IAM 14324]KEI36168.1 hypothetical protein L969DRAFT_106145 [Mixia osmundae IAM 14324]KEI38136.1 hypothetical protein L969DRAFT_104727 [Mixia osmundae IAM 14324]GAA95055.1 hypothetical protein E5Q_01710 [Mixia osmundae IAM 14324]
MSNNIKVVCRFRPPNALELREAGGEPIVSIDPEGTTVKLKSQDALRGPDANGFTFDRAFEMDTKQEEVFEYGVRGIVDDVLSGFNGTVFAYGQTGSGKTYTMMGTDIEDPKMKGLIPRITEQIFASIMVSPPHIEYLVKCSYMEIYMERIRDLLAPQNDNLSIHEDKARGVYVKNLSVLYVGSAPEVYEIMKQGGLTRAVSATNMNAESSRSHSIFVISVNQRNTETGSQKNGNLYLVDLAGSEKVGKTGASGQTLEEAKKINKSLSALGMVINALTDGKSQHIPYRDSKLTRILQESLGGNSRTTLIINCSPSIYNEAETISTLRFGIRAKSIKNKARVNAELSPAELKALLKNAQRDIAQYQTYIALLEAELSIWRAGGTVDKEAWATLERARSQGPTLALASTDVPSTPNRSTTPINPAVGSLRDLESRPPTPTTVSLDRDEREEFLKRENDLQDQLAEKESALASHVEQLRTAQADFEALRASASRDAQSVGGLSALVNDLRSQLERLSHENREAQIVVDALKDQNADTTAELEDAKRQISELRMQQSRGLGGDKEKQRAEKMAALMGHFDTSSSTEHETQIREALDRLDKSLGAQLPHDSSDLDLLRRQIEDGQSALASHEERLRNSQAENAALSRRNEELEHRLRSAGQGYKDLASSQMPKDEMATAQQFGSDEEALQHQRASEQDLVDLRADLATKSAEIEALNASNGSLRSTLEETKRAFAITTAGIEGSKDLMERARDMERIRKTMVTQLADFDKMKKSLTKDLQDRCEKVVELEISLDETREQYNAVIRNGNSRLQQRKMDFLTRNLDQLTLVQRQLVEQNASLKKDVSVAERKLTARNERIQNLEQLLANAQDSLAAQNTKYNSQLQALHDRIEYERALSTRSSPQAVNAASAASALQFGRVARPLRGAGSATAETAPSPLNASLAATNTVRLFGSLDPCKLSFRSSQHGSDSKDKQPLTISLAHAIKVKRLFERSSMSAMASMSSAHTAATRLSDQGSPTIRPSQAGACGQTLDQSYVPTDSDDAKWSDLLRHATDSVNEEQHVSRLQASRARSLTNVAAAVAAAAAAAAANAITHDHAHPSHDPLAPRRSSAVTFSTTSDHATGTPSSDHSLASQAHTLDNKPVGQPDEAQDMSQTIWGRAWAGSIAQDRSLPSSPGARRAFARAIGRDDQGFLRSTNSTESLSTLAARRQDALRKLPKHAASYSIEPRNRLDELAVSDELRSDSSAWPDLAYSEPPSHVRPSPSAASLTSLYGSSTPTTPASSPATAKLELAAATEHQTLVSELLSPRSPRARLHMSHQDKTVVHSPSSNGLRHAAVAAKQASPLTIRRHRSLLADPHEDGSPSQAASDLSTINDSFDSNGRGSADDHRRRRSFAPPPSSHASSPLSCSSRGVSVPETLAYDALYGSSPRDSVVRSPGQQREVKHAQAQAQAQQAPYMSWSGANIEGQDAALARQFQQMRASPRHATLPLEGEVDLSPRWSPSYDPRSLPPATAVWSLPPSPRPTPDQALYMSAGQVVGPLPGLANLQAGYAAMPYAAGILDQQQAYGPQIFTKLDLLPQQVAQTHVDLTTAIQSDRQFQPMYAQVLHNYSHALAKPASPNQYRASPPAIEHHAIDRLQSDRRTEWRLQDVKGQLVAFSRDQVGSRWIQAKFVDASSADRLAVFNELSPALLELSQDCFSNYCCQQLFAHGTPAQRAELVGRLKGHVLHLSLSLYGCRVIQKAIEHCTLDLQLTIMNELREHIIRCSKDLNANHCIQRILCDVPEQHTTFIADACRGHVARLATNSYACRVIQRLFENARPQTLRPLLEEALNHCNALMNDQFGNYVIQHIVEKGQDCDRKRVIASLKGKLLSHCMSKYASNVVERCVMRATDKDLQWLVKESLDPLPDGNSPIAIMLGDMFANYALGTMLKTVRHEPTRSQLWEETRHQLQCVRQRGATKHVNAIEKLLDAA